MSGASLLPAPVAPVAPAPADSAELRAQVPEEPAVPVPARVVLVEPVPADLLLRLAVPVPVPVHLAVLVQRPLPRERGRRPALALWVLDPAVPVELLLSRQSFSAAMARSTPSPAPTFEPVPR